MNSEKNVLFIIPPKDFREEEFFTPKAMLENAGMTVKVASSTGGECYGTDGKIAIADSNFSEVNTVDFDAAVLIGGAGVEAFFTDDDLYKLIGEFSSDAKIIGAICWAPVILANAGLLNGKKATVWEGAKNDIISKGAIYTGELATVDGKIVTANGPQASEEFALKLIEVLEG